ncbi:MAG TPA: SDR family NAD(P)-dependent oxidoreductase, partial [Ruminiclostridium sp.]|nr:SDR family NAD(P)-dependent oxidoreductase [Ruminiclostridium sp.]
SSAGFERLSINPLLQMNISDLSEQKFTSVFSGNEFFLSNHVIEGNKILPGVAYLEMVREAACQSSGLIAGENTVIIKNVVFIRPAIVKNNKLQVNVRVKPHDVDELTFEVYSSENSENEIIYCRGAVSFDRTESCADFDIMSFEKECSQRTITDVECYKNFAKSGFDYGCEFRGIKKALLGEQKIISEIELPNSTAQTDKGFYLHPAVMDCALQTALVLMGNETGCAAGLPFTVSKVKVIGPTSSKMWAVARPADSMAGKIHSYDIDLLDGAGRLCVRFSGVSFKTEENKFNSMSISQVGESILLFDKTFKQCDIAIPQKHINYSERIIIFCGINEETAHKIKSMAGVSACVCFNPKTYGAAEFFEKLSLLVFENIKRAILKRHEGKILFQVLIEDSPQNMVVQGLDGLFKTACLECQRLAYQLITVGSSDCTGASKLLAQNVDEPSGNIKYADGKRYAACWEELDSIASPAKKAFKNGGVYLITGGAGGLGYILACEIADSTENTHIILTGRSPCDDEIAGKIELLKNKGADVSYIRSNATDKNDVCLLADTILKNNKCVNGIMHCAGLIRDNYIINKSADDMRAVMGPKLFGTYYIDEAFKDQPLDFFILFSSFSGCMGNPGQADYAAASSFMDAFSQYRNTLVKSGERNGRTLAVDWPLCRDGGMHVDSNTEKLMLQRLGLLPMNTDSFISAFYKALECDRSSVMVINGDAKTIRQKIICDLPTVENNADWKERKEGKRISARDKVLAALVSNVSEIIKVSPQEICEESELSEYGFESITYTELAGKLNDEFNLELNPTVFFEYPTIKSIAEFILPSCPVEEAESFTNSDTAAEENTDKVLPDTKDYRNIECDTAANAEKKENGGQPVAVIGMSGRFPMADNLDEFWDNLLDGKDCISEVPQGRWDWREYFGDPKNGGDKTNIKWGGFINGIDEFDPMFFGITPGEAEIMDPAQRLLMTYVWEALEDAGISPQTLSGSNTGIFTGIINSGYERLISKADKDSGSFFINRNAPLDRTQPHQFFP